MTHMSFNINYVFIIVRFLISLCFRCPICVYRMLCDCEVKCNIIILVIQVVRYVSLYLFQIWLDICSS